MFYKVLKENIQEFCENEEDLNMSRQIDTIVFINAGTERMKFRGRRLGAEAHLGSNFVTMSRSE